MSRFSFQLADEKDDAELRSIIAENIMNGNISVSFRCEPSYFSACKIQGSSYEIMKCVDKEKSVILGLGSRFTYDAYINGERSKIGYLGDLTGRKEYRNGTLLARAYKTLKEMHDKNPLPFYTTVIWGDNETALKILPSGRAGLPIYKPMGKFTTSAVLLGKPKKTIKIDGINFKYGTSEQIPQIFKFIQEQFKIKQFAPFYNISDFGSSRLQDLKAEDFYLAVKDNEIIGVIAAWDQKNFRQTHIENYSPLFQAAKPFYNFYSKFSGLKPLLPIGTRIPFFYISLVAIKDNNPAVFSALLRYVYNERCDRYHYFICGFHENDPLNSALQQYRQIKSGGYLFCVYYPENQDQITTLDSRIPYIEPATI